VRAFDILSALMLSTCCTKGPVMTAKQTPCEDYNTGRQIVIKSLQESCLMQNRKANNITNFCFC